MATTAVHGTIDFTIVERSDDRVVGAMPVQPGILNPYGVVHVGALLWFADVCATVLVLGGADPVPGGGGFPLAIALHAAFLANQKDGVLEAQAAFVKRGRRLSVVRTTVTGAGSRLLADVTTSHVPANGSSPPPPGAPMTITPRMLPSALALSCLMLAPAPPARAQSPPGVESRFADVGGIRLHYLSAGEGDVVVLLHGYTQTSHMWLPLIARLAKAHAVIAPDLRGAGQSAKPATGYDKKSLAQDIHTLVQSLGHRRVTLVGHDIGLMVAYAYAAQYPDQVERIALMDAFLPGVGNWKEVWLLRDLWHFHFTGEVPLKLVSGRERIYFEHFWNDFAADPTRSVPEADRELYAASYAQPGGMRAGFAYFQAFQQDAVDFEAFSKRKLAMPMLVLTGEKASGTFLIEQGRLVASDVRGVVIEGSGHWLLEEAPGQVIPLLVAFIAGEPVSGPTPTTSSP